MKGRTFESRKDLVILEKAMNPSGGAIIIGVLVAAAMGSNQKSDRVLKLSGNRPVWPLLLGWCGGWVLGEKPHKR